MVEDNFEVDFNELSGGQDSDVPLTRKEEASLNHPSDILSVPEDDENEPIEEEQEATAQEVIPSEGEKEEEEVKAQESMHEAAAEESRQEEVGKKGAKQDYSMLEEDEEAIYSFPLESEEEEEEEPPPPPQRAVKKKPTPLVQQPKVKRVRQAAAAPQTKKKKRTAQAKASVPKPKISRYDAEIYGSKTPSKEIDTYVYITDVTIEVCSKFVERSPKLLKQCLENNFDEEIWIELDDIEKREVSKYPYLAVKIKDKDVIALPIKNPHVDIIEADLSYFTDVNELQQAVSRLRAMVKALQIENEELENKIREYKELLEKKDQEIMKLKKNCGISSVAAPITEIVKEVVRGQKEVAVAKYQSEAEKEKARSIKEVAKPPAVSIGDIPFVIQSITQALSMIRGGGRGPSPSPPRQPMQGQMPPPPQAPPGGVYMPPAYYYPPWYGYGYPPPQYQQMPPPPPQQPPQGGWSAQPQPPQPQQQNIDSSDAPPPPPPSSRKNNKQ